MVQSSRDAIAREEPGIRAFAHIAEQNPVIGRQGPLAGVAIGVKDIFDTADQPTSYGSIVYRRPSARVDAAIVDLACRRAPP
jgi:Asp-tRNA(Asn)/Glu-tRNA(Gln) amidotransferase A subunit family amidase